MHFAYFVRLGPITISHNFNIGFSLIGDSRDPGQIINLTSNPSINGLSDVTVDD